MPPQRNANRKRRLSNRQASPVADVIGGASHHIALSSKSAKVAASVILFCAAMLCMTEFDSTGTSLRGIGVIDRRAGINSVRRALAEEKEESAADETEEEDKSKDDEKEDDDDGFDDDEVGDDDYVEEKLEHEELFKEIVDHLYAAYTSGTSPGYLETYAEHGWGFAGIENIDNSWGLRDQVQTIAYPEKFSCAIVDEESGKPKIKLTEEEEEEEKRCFVRLMPLLDVIDDVIAIPDMMFRYKQSIMDRFNQLHSAVKKKLDEDERKEAIRKANEAREKAKQQQQQEMAQVKGSMGPVITSDASDGEAVAAEA